MAEITVTVERSDNTTFFTTTGGASGSGNGKTQAGSIRMNAGDTVRWYNTGIGLLSITGLNYFTNNANFSLSANNNGSRTWASSVVAGNVDAITMSKGTTGTFAPILYLSQKPATIAPDITVNASSSNIPETATSAQTTVTNVTSGEYYAVRVNNGSTNLGASLASSGSVDIIFSSELPTAPGTPVTYEIYSMRPTSLSGDGLWDATDDTFTVTTYEVAQPASITPPIDDYGIAIYDNNSTLVTSFAQGHSILREVFVSNVTLSASTYTDVATGLTGLSYSNCIIQVRIDGSISSAISVPTTFVNGTTVRIGRYAATVVTVVVLQYAGASKGITAATYGTQIINGTNNIVIDEGALTYGVKEIINGGDSRVVQGTQISGNASYGTITLPTTGSITYPIANGAPAIGINCTSQSVLVPPMLGATVVNGCYSKVYFFKPPTTPIADYNIAMLVPSSIATPSYYNSADTYGFEIRNAAGALVWSSAWRQAVVNNIVPINIFSTGLTQNGSYDVTAGYDGVTAPPIPPTPQRAETTYELTPTGQSVGVSSLNDMDPTNTYLIGGMAAGKVSYYSGRNYYGDLSTQYNLDGGAVFVPAAIVTGANSVSIKMWRQFFPGFPPPSQATESKRESDSLHPEGNFIFARIT